MTRSLGLVPRRLAALVRTISISQRRSRFPRRLGLALPALLLTACAPAGTSTPTAISESAQLRALEQSVLGDVKAATTSLGASDLPGAASRLIAIGRGGEQILAWLDAHGAFEQANRAGTECLRETMRDLGEQADELPPALRGGSVTLGQLDEVRLDLGEAANCVQSSD